MIDGDTYLLWPRGTAICCTHFRGGGSRPPAAAANARQAAALYPVHRCSAKGVSTSVGTALGFYEGAAAARGNRKHDRNVMIFGISGQEETLTQGRLCVTGLVHLVLALRRDVDGGRTTSCGVGGAAGKGSTAM